MADAVSRAPHSSSLPRQTLGGPLRLSTGLRKLMARPRTSDLRGGGDIVAARPPYLGAHGAPYENTPRIRASGRVRHAHRPVPLVTFFQAAVLILGLLGPIVRLEAQEHATSGAPAATPTAEATPLGRDVPRGAVRAFLEACEHGDFDDAATYLNLRRPPKAIATTPPRLLARDLSAVLDRKLWINVDALSDDPEGNPNDDLPRGIDALGSIVTANGPVPILIERGRDHDGMVWTIAAATVAQIPQLYAEFGYGPLGHLLPPVFFDLRFLGVQLWQWLGLLVLLPATWVLARLVTAVLVRIAKGLARRTKTSFDDAFVRNSAGPARVVVAALLFELGSVGMALGVRAQDVISGGRHLLLVVASAWLAVRLTDVFGGMIVERRQQAAAFMPLGRRTVKVVAIGLATIATMRSFGFDVSSLLAGLGIGGLAVALASQKTVEHLFGGVTLITDQPVRVGDTCKFGDKTGVVEDIGLRSTRIRTPERTVVSVPNGEFSAMQIENLSRRDRMRLHTVLNLRYESTADQLRYLITEIRKLVVAGPKVDEPSVNVRFVAFGVYSLDVEIAAYVKTTNDTEFAIIREDLFLRIMDLVEAAGSGFAFPSQTIYSGKDVGVDESKRQEVAAQVRQRSTDGDP